ncbi:MAG TPA: tetratricopeptide repeat protein [Methylomirabilota bacterium]|nr:tetratricopeptide repeat protein [Methylomirabilota bacterium]
MTTGEWVRRVGVLGPVLLLVLGTAAYWGTLDAPFIFDDTNAIVDNPHIRSLLPLGRSLSAPDQSTVAGRPVAAFSLALNHAVSGLEPWSYHLANIAIHLATGLLLFDVLRRTLARPELAARGGVPGPWFALAAAAIWLVHPLNTESVTYVSTRTESLVGLLFLAALYCLIRSVDSARPTAWSAACVTATALAMGTKEVAVALPVVLLAYAAVFLDRGVADSLRRRPRLWAGVAATWLILAWLVAGGARSETVGFGFADLGPLDYARTQVGVIWHYLRLAVWPHPLVLDYFDWPIARHGSFALWLGGAVLVALALGSLWLVRRRHWLGFLGVWFFAILAPTSSVVPIATEIAAERRMYLPLMAVVVLACAAAWWLAGRLPAGRRRPVLTAAAVLVCTGLGALTVARNRVYGDELAIWEDTVRTRPGNPRALQNLGSVLVRRGDRDRAAEAFRAALAAAPGFAPALEGLGGVLVDQGRRREGAELLHSAVAVNPVAHDALENLGLIALDEGRIADALELLERAARLRPEDEVTRLNLAKARLAGGDPAAALAELREAVRLAPDNALAHARLAQLLAAGGDAGEAARHARLAAELDPDDPEVRRTVDAVAAASRGGGADEAQSAEAMLKRAAGLAGQARWQEARRELAAVVEREPDSARLVELAQRCFVGIDRATAVELLRTAVGQRPSDPPLHLGLGRLLAAAGADREALAAYGHALGLRPGWADAGNSLALLLATAADPEVRDPDRALRISRELVAAADPPHPLLLGTLGVALASAGDRSEAAAVLERAVAEASARGDAAAAAHLDRYRSMIAGGWPPPPGSGARVDGSADRPVGRP